MFFLFCFSIFSLQWVHGFNNRQNILELLPENDLLRDKLKNEKYDFWVKKDTEDQEGAFTMGSVTYRKYYGHSNEAAIMLQESDDYSLFTPFIQIPSSNNNQTDGNTLILKVVETPNTPQNAEMKIPPKPNEHPLSVRYNKRFQPISDDNIDDDYNPNKENLPLYKKSDAKLRVESSNIDYDESTSTEKYIPRKDPVVPVVRANIQSHQRETPRSNLCSLSYYFIGALGVLSSSVFVMFCVVIIRSRKKNAKIILEESKIDEPSLPILNMQTLDQIYQMIQLFKLNNVGSIIDELNFPSNYSANGFEALKIHYSDNFYLNSNCDTIIIIRNLYQHGKISEAKSLHYLSLFNGLSDHILSWYLIHKPTYDLCGGPNSEQFLASLPKKFPKRLKNKK